MGTIRRTNSSSSGISKHTASTLNNRVSTHDAESSAPGWLGVFFGDTYRRRVVVALAASIALHEIAAGLIPPKVPPQESTAERVEHVTVARIEKRPLPTPSPTPKPPKPQALAHARIITTVQPTIVPHTTSGTSAHKEPIKRIAAARPKPPKISHAKPIWDLPVVGGQGAGAGDKSGAGSAGQGGTGSGAGDSGTGSGAGEAPCGAVYFQSVDNQPPRFDKDSGFYIYDKIRMSVHMADGSVQDIVLDYPWRYKDEAGDPLVAGHEDVPMIFQRPPKDMRANEPPLVQYVMKHSTAEGFTELTDCP